MSWWNRLRTINSLCRLTDALRRDGSCSSGPRIAVAAHAAGCKLLSERTMRRPSTETQPSPSSMAQVPTRTTFVLVRGLCLPPPIAWPHGGRMAARSRVEEEENA